MKTNIKSKWIFATGAAIAVIAISGVLLKWNQQKVEYAKSQTELAELTKTIPQEINQIKKSYLNRNYFVLSLLASPKLKTSPFSQVLKTRLADAFKQMELNELQTTEQLTRFERLAAYTNQLLTDEVLKLNENNKDTAKKSALFNDQKQVRELERYDLAIDHSRKNYAQTSWRVLQLKSKIEKNWNHKTAITIAPYFPADVMVVDHQKKTLNKVM